MEVCICKFKLSWCGSLAGILTKPIHVHMPTAARFFGSHTRSQKDIIEKLQQSALNTKCSSNKNQQWESFLFDSFIYVYLNFQ